VQDLNQDLVSNESFWCGRVGGFGKTFNPAVYEKGPDVLCGLMVERGGAFNRGFESYVVVEGCEWV
jgi:hypothetical protein